MPNAHHQNRRSYYGLKAESPLSDEQLLALVQRAVKFAPNSFNMQQSRAVLITGKKHTELWDMILSQYMQVVKGNSEQPTSCPLFRR